MHQRFTYLGKHRDETGPTYAVSSDDPDLSGDMSPGNCGTWVTITHDHCAAAGEAHPPDCPAGETPTNDGSAPAHESRACEDPAVAAAVLPAVDGQPDPGTGLQPLPSGYVMVPIRALYPHDALLDVRVRVDDETVDLRIWIADVSWSFTDLGTMDGSDLRTRTFRRTVTHHRRAGTVNTPVTVTIDGQTAVYLRSSLRAGYPDGYPITVTIRWKAECKDPGVPGFAYSGEEIRSFSYEYKVYTIRSRPDQVRLARSGPDPRAPGCSFRTRTGCRTVQSPAALLLVSVALAVPVLPGSRRRSLFVWKMLSSGRDPGLRPTRIRSLVPNST